MATVTGTAEQPGGQRKMMMTRKMMGGGKRPTTFTSASSSSSGLCVGRKISSQRSQRCGWRNPSFDPLGLLGGNGRRSHSYPTSCSVRSSSSSWLPVLLPWRTASPCLSLSSIRVTFLKVSFKQRQRLRGATLSQRASWGYAEFASFSTTPSRPSSSSSSAVDNKEKDISPLRQKYQALVQQQHIQSDTVQGEALKALERLYFDLQTHPPPPPPSSSSASSSSSSSTTSSWTSSSSWWTGGGTPTNTLTSKLWPSSSRIQGVYLHGGVGCGKTFLMNLFHDQLHLMASNKSPSASSSPSVSNLTAWAHSLQKVHFHKFMLQVHETMHQARYTYDADLPTHPTAHRGDDLMPTVVQKLVRQGRLWCLDEFQVTDVADALILQRLFTGLWAQGCILVATSNRPPTDLYLHGLQRDRFLPFIDLLQRHCQIVSLQQSETDYRLVQKLSSRTLSSSSSSTTSSSDPTTSSSSSSSSTTAPSQQHALIFVGGPEVRQQAEDLFYELIGPNAPVSPTVLYTQGRKVQVPRAAVSKGVAWFTFEDLCQKALGAADYQVIGQHFHTVFVVRIPQLTRQELNWVRRFILFIDTMYDMNVKVILHTKVSLSDIFQRGEDDHTTQPASRVTTGASASTSTLPSSSDAAHAARTTTHYKTNNKFAADAQDEFFAFDRTLSRLEEMTSLSYVQRKWVGASRKPPEESAAALLSHRRAVVQIEPS